jgi:hypothetical protein
LSNGATNQAVNAEASQAFIAPVDENEFSGGPCSSEQSELIRRTLADGTDAHLIVFAHEPHRRRAAQVISPIVKRAASSARAFIVKEMDVCQRADETLCAVNIYEIPYRRAVL